MKKIIVAVAVILSCSNIIAQTEYDALKYTQNDITGTARYMGMAGAFGALGGDPSAIKDNPAGLGIYRKSELAGTMNMTMQNTNSNWKYTEGGTTKNSFGYATDPFKIGFNNFSLVIATPTWRNESGTSGLLSSNWSFSFNRLKSFNRTATINSGSSASSMTDFMAYFSHDLSEADLSGANGNAYDNMYIPWISVLAKEGHLIKPVTTPGSVPNSWESLLAIGETVTPSFTLSEQGFVDEYSLGWAGNFNNVFYLGTTLNLLRVDYSMFTQYDEEFKNGGGMNLNNTVSTTGSGVNLKIGAIVRPTDYLRFGLAVHTPTMYSLEDNYQSTLKFDTDIRGSVSTPTDGYNNFKIQGPMQINASAAAVIDKKGIISVEYDYSNYTGTKFMDEEGNTQSYTEDNARIPNTLNDVHTIKIGGEYKVTDNFSLRAGFANSSSATKADGGKIMVENTTRTDTEYFLQNGTNYLTAGFGYREAGWFIDCAYVHKNMDQTFMPYNSNLLSSNLAVTPATVTTKTNNILVTLGFKF
jgi:hypothetical protein